MKLGTVNSTMALDRPHYIYSGNSLPVTGKVFLKFEPGKKSTSEELFGPLKVTISFWGRAKSKVTVSRGQNGSQSYRGRAALFHITQVVHDGPFTATTTKPFEVPFIVEFPAQTMPTSRYRSANHFGPQWGPAGVAWQPNSMWEPSTVYEGDPGHPLPPSLYGGDSGFGHSFEAIVEYKISANINVPGIEVDTPDPIEASVRYSPPNLMQPADYLHMLRVTRRQTVQTKMLLPEDERPSGFRQKTKAALSSNAYPKFPFNVILTMLQNLPIGTKPCLTIQADPLLHDPECTMQHAPDIELLDYTLKIKGLTSVRAEKSVFNEHTDSGTETLYKHEVITPPVPKSPVNAPPRPDPIKLCASNDWRANIRFKPIENLVPSFKTYNILRIYMPTAKVKLQCAGEKIEVEVVFPRCVLHPYERDESGATNGEPGPSQVRNTGEMLPDYEGLDLPTYEGSSNTTLLKTAPVELASGLPGKRG